MALDHILHPSLRVARSLCSFNSPIPPCSSHVLFKWVLIKGMKQWWWTNLLLFVVPATRACFTWTLDSDTEYCFIWLGVCMHFIRTAVWHVHILLHFPACLLSAQVAIIVFLLVKPRHDTAYTGIKNEFLMHLWILSWKFCSLETPHPLSLPRQELAVYFLPD